MMASKATTYRVATFSPVWRAGLLAAGVAAGANAVLYLLARTLGVSFLMSSQPGMEPMALPLTMVILASTAGAVAGTVVFALLSRWTPYGTRLFQLVGLMFLVLSFGGPLSLSISDGATKATLLAMHVIAGGATIGLLSRSPER